MFNTDWRHKPSMNIPETRSRYLQFMVTFHKRIYLLESGCSQAQADIYNICYRKHNIYRSQLPQYCYSVTHAPALKLIDAFSNHPLQWNQVSWLGRCLILGASLIRFTWAAVCYTTDLLWAPATSHVQRLFRKELCNQEAKVIEHSEVVDIKVE